MDASGKTRKVFSSGTPALQMYYILVVMMALWGEHAEEFVHIQIYIYKYTYIYIHYIMLDSVGELLMEKKKSHRHQRSYFL